MIFKLNSLNCGVNIFLIKNTWYNYEETNNVQFED